MKILGHLGKRIKMLEQFKELVYEKVFDYVTGWLGRKIRKVKYEKVMWALFLLFAIAGVAILIYNGFSEQTNIIIKFGTNYIDESRDGKHKDLSEDGNNIIIKEDDDVSDAMNIIDDGATGVATATKDEVTTMNASFSFYALIGVLLLAVGIFFFLGWLLLRVEKKNNAKTTIFKRRELQTEMAQQTNELLRIIHQYERDVLLPDIWKIPKGSDPSRIDTQSLNEAYNSFTKFILTEYRAICAFIVDIVYKHVQSINSDDNIHVSIKAFSKNHYGKSIVFTLGHDSRGKGGVRVKPLDRGFDNWEDMINAAYLLTDDYALYRVCCDKRFRAFNCGDINTFKRHQDDIDPFGRYRKPVHLTRDYNATLVCPVFYLSHGDPRPIGAVCVDTTSTYNDWCQSNSYEEELLTFVSASISHLMMHNIDELNLAIKRLNKLGK